MYSKPHRSYEQQLTLLESRGLVVADREGGLALLRRVGYYRLSAYVYPFRELLPDSERCVDSPAQFRAEQVRPGVTLGHVAELCRFDERLRLRILEGLATLEVGLRTQVAHVLGARDTFGHLNKAALDADACAKVRKTTSGLEATAFEEWTQRYRKLQTDARSEDYVRHHLTKYGEPLPVWVAIEFLDFGAVAKLYSLLDRADQNAVAAELGVKGGRSLDSWLKSLNYLRNMAAHHNRLWNRSLTLKIGKFNEHQVGASLQHAAALEPLDKLYRALAATAYLVKRIEPTTRWHVNIRDHVRKFPQVPYLSASKDMGFPEGWDGLELWRP